MDIFLLIIMGVIGFLTILFLSLFLYKYYLRYSTRIKTSNGISSLEEITLGGLKQWIFIRGTNQDNPVLLFLHGGPGEPALGMSSSRKFDAELIRHFTMVHWDQRGAGKSYSPDIPINSMTLHRLVEDCNELIDYLQNKFDTPKVFLVAFSSGTLIGIRTAYRYPEKIHAYVGVAQVVNDYEQQRLSYNFIVTEAEKSGEVKTKNAITSLGPPPYDTPEMFHKMTKYLDRYGGFMHKFSIMQMFSIVFNYMTSPEYSLLEGYRTLRGKGFQFSMNAMWEEIKNVDFTEEIQSLNVPIYFFMGKHDMIHPSVLVENFYNKLDAEKGKSLVMFENSAHFLMIEEKEKYQNLLINTVLKEWHENQGES